MKKISAIFMMVLMLTAFSVPVLAAGTNSDKETKQTTAEETTETSDSTGSKALAAAICVGLAAAAGDIGMGISIAKINEWIVRQSEGEGMLHTSLMLGLVFIETAIIYALIIAILIIFVL